ncbi:unnamed protein product [Pylaiella littoralis]
MNSRRGLWGWDGKTQTSRAAALPARNRRAGLESIVSSSRFRLRSSPSWMTHPGEVFSAIDWDAKRGVVAVGTSYGGLGMRVSRRDHPVFGGGDADRSLRGFSPGQGGAQRQEEEEEDEERVRWTIASPLSLSQVSDVKFQAHGNEWACAAALIGHAADPGGIHVRFWSEGELEGAQGSVDPASIVPSARTVNTKLRCGSVWCTEWDPFAPESLAVGPSSCCPVSYFNVETGKLFPVANLLSDVFSMSFLPAAAPGAGRAFVCGLRDGSVFLVDSRRPQRLNGRTKIAHGSRCSGGGGFSGRGGRCSNAKLGGPRRRYSVSVTADPEYTVEPLALLDCSSVDHTHILRDGTRCLIKDRTGGLQTVDLRFFDCQGQGSGRGRGQERARPLKVLVPTREPVGTRGVRSSVPGSFALDPTETIVATPVSTTAAAKSGGGDGGGGGGGGTAMASGGGAWDAFSSYSSTVSLYHQYAATGHRHPSDAGDTANTGGGGDADALFPGRDRLRILDVTSGRVLNDIQTPWTHMSLARGAGATLDGADGSSYGGVQFWGTARDPERGPAVFQAGLWSEPGGGYGRL